MKILNKILLAITGASMLAVSCDVQKFQEDKYIPGEQEEAGCYGVFFPTQTVNATFEPGTEDYPFSITLNRTDEKDAITVPVEFDGTAAQYVKLDPVKFADGQKEVTINGTLDKNMPQNTEMTVSICIMDGKYASKYNTKPSFLKFKTVVESWEYLGEGEIADNWIEADDWFKCKYYRNASDTSRYRVADPYKAFWEKWGPAYQKGGWVLCDYPEKIEFRILQVGEILHEGDKGYETEITKENLIYYSPFKIGLHHPSYGKDIYRYHPGDFSSLAGDDASFVNNRVDNWQDSGIPSIVYLSSYVYMPGVGGWGAYEDTKEALTLKFPGGVFVDYTIVVKAGSSTEGKLPIDFTLGKDVEKVRYAVYEGELTSKQIRGKQALIAAKEEPAQKELDIKKPAIDFTADTTNIYTLVAVTFDKNDKSQKNTSVSFGYVKKGDEKKVEIIAGAKLELPSEAYQAIGYDTLSNLSINLYGKDIKNASLNLFTKEEYQKDSADCWSKLGVVNESLIEMINQPGGYTEIATKLNPLTEYVLLAKFDNGFKESSIKSVCSTKGLPNIKLRTGTYSTKVLFDDEDAAELYFNPNTTNEFQLKYNFGAFNFNVKADSSITIEPQVPGYSHKSYGTLYFGEVLEMMKFMYPTNYQTAIAYYENQGMEITSIAGTSKINSADSTYKFAVCWYLTAGYIGTGVDVFDPDIPEEKNVKMSTGNIKWFKAIKPTRQLNELNNIIWNVPQFEREAKPAKYTVTPGTYNQVATNAKNCLYIPIENIK